MFLKYFAGLFGESFGDGCYIFLNEKACASRRMPFRCIWDEPLVYCFQLTPYKFFINMFPILISRCPP